MSDATLLPPVTRAPLIADERRKSVRYPCGRKCLCWPLKQSPFRYWPAKVRDISTAGVCLFTDRSFELGTVLVIEMDETDRDASRLLLARVVRSTERKRGGYQLGCALSLELSDHKLLSMLPYPA